MGKLNKQVDFINDAIKNRQELDFTSYSRFLESAPIFITYYKQNTEESTLDYGIASTQTFIGADSSIRYNRIKSVPLYGLNLTQIDISEDETGATASFQSEGIMLPGTFTPIPNDYFMIDYMGKDIVFKVTNVVAGTIKSNDYIKIEFKFNQILEDHEQERLDKQVVTDNTIIFDNIGSENKALVTDDAFKRAQWLKELYTKFAEDYIDYFFVSEVNSFICEYPVDGLDKKELAYNPYLTHFMIQNGLFTGDNTPKILALEIETSVAKDFKNNYKNSIFKTIESRYKYDIEKVYNNQFFKFINEQTSIFFERATEYLRIELIPHKLPFFGPMLNPEIIAFLAELDEEYYKGLWSPEYNTSFSTGETTNDHFFSCQIARPEKPIYNMNFELSDIVKNHLDHKKSKLTIDYMKNLCQYGQISYDPDTFILVPLVLYIIQFELNEIQRKDTNK